MKLLVIIFQRRYESNIASDDKKKIGNVERKNTTIQNSSKIIPKK